jgi:hypothetical protein
MAKQTTNFQTGLFAIFILLLFFWILYIFFGAKGTFLESRNTAKPSIYAGYYGSETLDYCFEAFTDSSFIVYTMFDTVSGNWQMNNDTLFLQKDGNQCAKIYNKQLIDNQCLELKSLTQMQFKYYKRPRVALFPKPK